MLNKDGCEDSDQIKKVHTDFFAESFISCLFMITFPAVQLYSEMDLNDNTTVF